MVRRAGPTSHDDGATERTARSPVERPTESFTMNPCREKHLNEIAVGVGVDAQAGRT